MTKAARDDLHDRPCTRRAGRIRRSPTVRSPTVLALAAALAAIGCDSTGPTGTVVFEFDFSTSDHGFDGSFSDVAVAEAENVDFEARHRTLPDPLTGGALYHAGTNISDDLFMFFTRRVDGLEPGGRYAATFSLEIATRIGEDCTIGVGAAVLVKAGAAGEEVRRVVVVQNDRDEYRLSVDKGNQANDGTAGVVIGDIRNGLPGCGAQVPYEREPVSEAGKEVIVQADQDGAVWLFFGTESAFESPHETYFTLFRAELRSLE